MVSERLAGEYGLDRHCVIDALMERERLGSTAVGDGVSIPHARFGGLKNAIGVFVRLARPIDMDAMDDRPVDLLFVLLAPEDTDAEHLKVLARVARVIRSQDNQMMLRDSDSKEAVLSILISEDRA